MKDLPILLNLNLLFLITLCSGDISCKFGVSQMQ